MSGPGGLCRWKIPVTPSGIEPATFRLRTPFENKFTRIFTSSVLRFPVYSAQRICEPVNVTFLHWVSACSPLLNTVGLLAAVVEKLHHLCSAAEDVILTHWGKDEGRNFSNAVIIWFGGSSRDFSGFIHCLPKQGCENELECRGSAQISTCASCPEWYVLPAVASWTKSGGYIT